MLLEKASVNPMHGSESTDCTRVQLLFLRLDLTFSLR